MSDERPEINNILYAFSGWSIALLYTSNCKTIYGVLVGLGVLSLCLRYIFKYYDFKYLGYGTVLGLLTYMVLR